MFLGGGCAPPALAWSASRRAPSFLIRPPPQPPPCFSVFLSAPCFRFSADKDLTVSRPFFYTNYKKNSHWRPVGAQNTGNKFVPPSSIFGSVLACFRRLNGAVSFRDEPTSSGPSFVLARASPRRFSSSFAKVIQPSALEKFQVAVGRNVRIRKLAQQFNR